MSEKLDKFDIQILDSLQQDSSLSMDELAQRARLSRNACWRRMKRLEEDGYIRGRVVLLDPEKLGCGLSAFVMIRASSHDPGWMRRFDRAVNALPQIVSAHRMAGDLDYILRVRLCDVAAYDEFYKDLIGRVPLLDISASFVMEDIKETTALPLPLP